MSFKNITFSSYWTVEGTLVSGELLLNKQTCPIEAGQVFRINCPVDNLEDAKRYIKNQYEGDVEWKFDSLPPEYKEPDVKPKDKYPDFFQNWK